MFARHLPPSAGLPRVLALDDQAAAELPPELDLTRDPAAPGPLDAIVGRATPEALAHWRQKLRPGGRLILAGPASADDPDGARYLQALTDAGFIHCLVERSDGLVLYRGERPPAGSPLDRLRAVVQAPGARTASPFLFLLVRQTPNKPAWEIASDEPVEWHAVTVIDPASGRPALPGFSSLARAVAFMQPAVLAGFLNGVNKVGKFRAETAATWPWPVIIDPEFEAWRGAALGPPCVVEPRLAVTGGE